MAETSASTAIDPKEVSPKRDASRETGWLDMARFDLQVDPPAEWRQMYDEAWRLMFGLEVIPALLFIVALFRIPESPRWLIQTGRTDDATENREQSEQQRLAGIPAEAGVGQVDRQHRQDQRR